MSHEGEIFLIFAFDILRKIVKYKGKYYYSFKTKKYCIYQNKYYSLKSNQLFWVEENSES